MKKKKKLNYNLYLTGFMGSGKSTIGAALSRIYRLDLIDTDRRIEKSEGMALSEIYEQYGEEYFREKERELFLKISKMKGQVVAAGGETLFNPGIAQIMKNGKIVLIKTPIEEVLKRVKRRNTRPSIMGKSDEEIIEMIRTREKAYEEAADIIVLTNGRDKEEVAEEIIEALF